MKRRLVIAALSLGIVFIALWALAWVRVGGEIPRYTKVLGVEIGARSRTGAINLLERRLASRIVGPIAFKTIDQVHQVSPSEIGARLDIEATVSAAKTRATNPFKLFAQVYSKSDLQPVVEVDQKMFGRKIEDLAKRSQVPLREGGVAFQGKTPIPIWPIDGESVDTTNALKQFITQWLRTSPIALTTVFQRAKVTSEKVHSALTGIAYPSVGEPITLVIDGRDLLVTPEELATSMTFVPDTQGNLAAYFSSDSLAHSLGAGWLKLVPPAKDAVFKFIDDKPRVYPSVTGRMISDEALTQALTPVLAATGSNRRALVATSIQQPRISTEEAGGLGISGLIAKFTTKYPYAAYRLQNIHRAADLIDGTIVHPGEIFSLNQTVGERTAENGFAEGIVIYDGHFAKDFGGGVSQVATTVWNAAWFSGVDLVAHMAHSFYISRYPAGREATVAWPNVDLKFRNDTGHVILLHTSYTSSSLTVSIYGTRQYTVETITGPRRNITDFAIYDDDTPTCITQDGVVGFDIDVTRVLKSGDVEVGREVFHTHYAPEDRITCTNPEATFGNPPIRAR